MTQLNCNKPEQDLTEQVDRFYRELRQDFRQASRNHTLSMTKALKLYLDQLDETPELADLQ